MLARADAQERMCFTCTGIAGVGGREVNNVLVIGNRGRRNSVSVFGARNSQCSSTFVAHALRDSYFSFLNRNGRRVPLDPLCGHDVDNKALLFEAFYLITDSLPRSFPVHSPFLSFRECSFPVH